LKAVFVLSCKGGVGKSSIATALASSLANILAAKKEKRRIGLVDCDVTNPTIPRLTGTVGKKFDIGKTIKPVKRRNLCIASVQLALPDRGLPIMWEGFMAGRMAHQFFHSIDWGEAEDFIIDTPPGIGDEVLLLLKGYKDHSACVIVTAPQQVSTDNVMRSINMCKELEVPILGLIENMAGFKCPGCGKEVDFGSGGKQLAEETEIDFLGAIPFDPSIAKEGDEGKVSTLTKHKAFQRLLGKVKIFLGV